MINEENYYPIIRLSNSYKSIKKEYYDSAFELNGKKLGLLSDSVFEDYTKEIFTKSEYSNYLKN